PAYGVFMLLTAIAMFAALLAVLTRTRVGLIIQAPLTRPDIAAMLGHSAARTCAPLRAAGRFSMRGRGPTSASLTRRPQGRWWVLWLYRRGVGCCSRDERGN